MKAKEIAEVEEEPRWETSHSSIEVGTIAHLAKLRSCVFAYSGKASEAERGGVGGQLPSFLPLLPPHFFQDLR